jgi:hypothetical protein
MIVTKKVKSRSSCNDERDFTESGKLWAINAKTKMVSRPDIRPDIMVALTFRLWHNLRKIKVFVLNKS